MFDLKDLNNETFVKKHLSARSQMALHKIRTGNDSSPFFNDDVCEFVQSYLYDPSLEQCTEFIKECVRFFRKGNTDKIIELYTNNYYKIK